MPEPLRTQSTTGDLFTTEEVQAAIECVLIVERRRAAKVLRDHAIGLKAEAEGDARHWQRIYDERTRLG